MMTNQELEEWYDRLCRKCAHSKADKHIIRRVLNELSKCKAENEILKSVRDELFDRLNQK